MLIVYLAILIVGCYWVIKNLGPEMAKPSIRKPIVRENPIGFIQVDNPDNRVDKLETLIAEKNKNIKFLQTELSVFLTQVRESEKVRTLLENEIHRLREQNRIFRSELGIPPIASHAERKENSLT